MKKIILYTLFCLLIVYSSSPIRAQSVAESTSNDFKFIHPRLRPFFKQQEELRKKFNKKTETERDSLLNNIKSGRVGLISQGDSNYLAKLQSNRFVGTSPKLNQYLIEINGSSKNQNDVQEINSGTQKYSNDNVTEEWAKTYAFNDDYVDDKATAIAYNRGFIYVTGFSGTTAGNDFITIKYDTLGIEQWTARYNGPGNGDDYATAVAVDSNGNVYVTGSSTGDGTYLDYATIKYSSSGIEQWVSRYNGLGDSSDYAYAIAIDDSGNVYVTGTSWDATSNYDYATIKYNNDGIQQWEKQYNGTGNFDDEVSAVAVDNFSNVCVTGKSWGSGTNYDYATILYKSNGAETVFRYDGTGNGIDEAMALAMDNAGNIFITGSSQGIGTGFDYVTINYRSNGYLIARYDSVDDKAIALALDDSGNVYVTGSTGYTITTIKYNINCNEQWKSERACDYYSIDDPFLVTGIAVDDSSNVYVTAGLSSSSGWTPANLITIKYNQNGNEQWFQNYETVSNGFNTGIVVGASENVYVIGYCNSEFYYECLYWFSVGFNYNFNTINYDKFGNTKWSIQYDGPKTSRSKSYPIDLKVEKLDNIYLTGKKEGMWQPWHTQKYNSIGTLIWDKKINSDEFGLVDPGEITYSSPISIAIDKEGNSYVGGRAYVNAGIFRCVSAPAYQTFKYNSNGVEQWRLTQNYWDWASEDKLTALIVDSTGNSYITGGSLNMLADESGYFTIKNDKNGIEQWRAFYSGEGGYPASKANSMKLDIFGNIYITGRISKDNLDYGTVKYNNDGVEQWNANFNGSGNGDDEAKCLAIDDSSNIYVTGITYNTITGIDFTTIKYNNAGQEKWVRNYNGTGNASDTAVAIDLDSAGNLYVAGTSRGTESGDDYLVIKYNRNGIEQWVSRYNSSANHNDQLVKMVLDRLGNVYVTGRSIGPSGTLDFVTVKYDTSGVEKWIMHANGEENRDDYVASIDVDSLGNVYVTGKTLGEGNTSSFLIVKYRQMNSVSGTVFNDFNGNGIKDTLETALSGWVINLDGPTASSVMSDTVGRFTFSNLEFGTYKVSETIPDGWMKTMPVIPDTYTVAININGTEVSGRDFGNFHLGTISGQVFNDKNGNGVKDIEDVGLENWLIKLSGIISDSITTDGYGNYTFTGLPLGSYGVSEVMKSEWKQSYPVSLGIHTVEITASGQTIPDVDFGNKISIYKTKINLAICDTNGTVIRDLYFGIRSGASYGIWGVDPGATSVDSIEGESELPPVMSGTFDVRFINPDRSIDYFRYGSWIDIRNFISRTQKDTFKISLQPGEFEYPMMLKWSGDLLDESFNGYVLLSQRANVWTSMKGTDSLLLLTNIFYIVSESPAIPVLYEADWNLISIPTVVSDPRKTILFPTALTNSYRYDNTYGYVVSDSLEVGIGYWLKFPTVIPPLTLEGNEVSSDTIDVFTGWNMIGTLNRVIPINDIETIPSGIIAGDFFGYNNSYYSTDTLKPFMGYWVKVSEDGILIIKKY